MSGSKTNDIYKFEFNGTSLVWTEIYKSEDKGNNIPPTRSSHCAGYYGSSMFIYGGEDEDHAKLEDIWEFNFDSKSWSKLESAAPAGGRSGHSASVKGSKIYIFGGILEVTKELNDMLVFDCSSKVISTLEESNSG